MKIARLSEFQAVPDKVLVIFPGALGDFICFLPVLEKLAGRRSVDLLARAEYAALLPATVMTRSLECYEITRLFIPGAERDERLRDFFGSYSFIYSWMGSGQPDFVRHLRMLSDGKLGIFPFRPSLQVHMTDYYLSCLGNKHPREIFPAIALRFDALAWSHRFWQQNGFERKRILVLAPGSGAKEKNWPIEFYRVMADWWERRFGGKVIVVLGPVEEEREERRNSWGRALMVHGLDLAEVAALLDRCDLYLGNDSGVSHLAAALGVETVVLFGPSDPAQWAPRGKRVTVITQDVECSPCAHPVMKVCPHRKCLTMLSPGDVIGMLEEVLERPPGVHELEVASLTRWDVGVKVEVKNDHKFGCDALLG